MFYHIRYQTGEVQDIIKEMRTGKIPCMDLANYDELNWFINRLKDHSIYRVDDIPYDKNARDRVKEPEFEFRAAFSDQALESGEFVNKDLMYIDIYFEPDVEETYDSIGEI